MGEFYPKRELNVWTALVKVYTGHKSLFCYLAKCLLGLVPLFGGEGRCK